MKKFLTILVLCSLVVFTGCFSNEIRQKEALDTQACDYAKKANDAKVWANYLRKFPQGMCAYIAESELGKHSGNMSEENSDPNMILCETGCTDTTTGYIWSSIAPFDMDWNQAYRYCSDLNENGYADWKLPSIQVLKTISYQNKWKSKFGDTGKFWSTTHSKNKAKSLTFSINLIDEDAYPTKAMVRCVKTK